MSDDFIVTVTDEARRRELEEVLGTSTVPVRSPTPVIASAPGLPGPSRFYVMDVRKLSEEQRVKLARHLAAKFGLRDREVLQELARNGLPILAEHCTVAVRNPLRWML